jgi:tetratricopeptide (TPR) repeat protein
MESLLEIIEKLRKPYWYLSHWGLMAIQYHLVHGDVANAELLLPSVLFQAERANDPYTLAMAQVMAGAVATEKLEFSKAQSILDQALTLCAKHLLAAPALMGWRYLAQLQLAQGDVSKAIDLAKRTDEMAMRDDLKHTREHYLVSLVQAKGLLAQGQIKAAGKLLETLWPQIIRTGFTPLMAETATLIGSLYQAYEQQPGISAKASQKGRSQEFFSKARKLWLDTGNTYQANLITG